MHKLIPNQHVEDSWYVRKNTVNLVIFGMPRSASTFVWQVLGDVYGAGVVRTHVWLDADASIPVVLTVRDWRDCVVSYFRSHHPRAREMDAEDVMQYVAKYQEFLWTLRRVWEPIQAEGRAPVLRFEEVVHDPARVYREARRWCHAPEVTEERLRGILDAHSIGVNRNIAANLQAFDKNTLLQPQHVHEAEAGAWRRFVRQENAELLTDLLAEDLAAWGYSDAKKNRGKET